MTLNINHTAIVDEGAIVGKNTSIWHWSHICNNAIIGENCKIGYKLRFPSENLSLTKCNGSGEEYLLKN